MTPRKEELTEKIASHGNSSLKVTLADGSCQIISVRLQKDSMRIIRRTFELVIQYFSRKEALKIYSDWLIYRSSFSDNRAYTHFLDFIQELLAEDSASDMPVDKKQTRQAEEILKVANNALKFWPRSFVESVLPIDNDEFKPEVKPSGKHKEFYRVLFLVQEEMSILGFEGKRVKRLRKSLEKLAYSEDFREHFSAEKKDRINRKIPSKIPNVQDCLQALMRKENKIMALPVDIKSPLFLLVCLYGAAFMGYDPRQTRNNLLTDYRDFITLGNATEIPVVASQYGDSKSVKLRFLADVCSICSPADWDSFSPAIKLPINILLDEIRDPEMTWNYSSRRLLNLKYILGFVEEENDLESLSFDADHSYPKETVVVQTWDGMDCLKPTNDWMIKLFPEDLRTSVAASLLNSSLPVLGKNVIDQANAENMMANAEPRLRQVSRRTVARTVGRGLATLATHRQMSLQSIRYPKIDLSMRLTAGFSDPNLLANMPTTPDGGTLWDIYPQFNNAVATTLSLADNLPLEGEVLTIPKGEEDEVPSCRDLATLSGAILGLGLRGYLNNEPNLMYLSYMSGPFSHMIFMASAVFIGYCCNPKMQGTQDLALTRLLSLHLPFLMPEAQEEDNRATISVMIQYSAIISLGFLHKKSLNQRFAKLLLEQIDSSMPNDKDHPKHCYREAYATMSGCALGLILQGSGPEFDEIAQELRPLSGCGPEVIGEEKVTRTSIEGCKNNTWVTAAGGISALALAFLGTGNEVVTDWLTVPNSDLALSKLRPVNIVLMSTAIGMINLDTIEPLEDWIESLKPAIVKEHGFNEKTFEVFTDAEKTKYRPKQPFFSKINVDFPHRAACDVAITSGAIFALGLKFMGTQNQKAAEIMKKTAEKWLKLSVMCHPDLMSSAFIHHCIGTVVLSWSMVRAGSGDVDCLRMCRQLSKILPEEVNFGLHLATCQAIGFLFLGGCKMSLKRDHDSIATMFVALMPKYPASVRDNSQYVWILRHLAALCVEFRACIPQMSDGYICRDSTATVLYKNGEKEVVKMPGVLPPLENVEKVTIRGKVGSYQCFPLVLRPEQLREVFANDGKVLMKRECEAALIEDLKDEANPEARKENILEEEKKCDWWFSMDHLKQPVKDCRVKLPKEFGDVWKENQGAKEDQKGKKILKAKRRNFASFLEPVLEPAMLQSDLSKELESIIRLENKSPNDNAYLELYTALAYQPKVLYMDLLDHVIDNMEAKNLRKGILESLLNRTEPSEQQPTARETQIRQLAAMFSAEMKLPVEPSTKAVPTIPDKFFNSWESFKDRGLY